jgi:Tol biopolymer transport system component
VRRIGAVCVLVSLAAVAAADAQNTTTRVSVATGGAAATGGFSGSPAISADGRFVAFASAASDLVLGDTNGSDDIFVHDRQTGKTERVNVSSSGAQATAGISHQPSISADGRFVAFVSTATNLVADTNGAPDVFVRDRTLSTTVRVSVVTGGGQASSSSEEPVMSADGRFVVFSSSASNLVTGDTNARIDVFRHDIQTQTTIRVSVRDGGGQVNGASGLPAVSATGRFVSFTSEATDLVSGDTNGQSDQFVRDVDAGTTTRISIGFGSQANSRSYFGTISGDGRYVAFSSDATNLVPDGKPGIYLRDRESATTALLVPGVVSGPNILMPYAPKITGDGQFVCYSALDPTGIFEEQTLIDRQARRTTRVSVTQNGEAVTTSSFDCAPSADGSFVAFSTKAANVVEGDTNGQLDVFVRTFFGTMALDKTALRFAAVTNGAAFASQTAAQAVRLTQAGIKAVGWTASSNQPWLHVTPASGSGSATLSIGVTPAAGVPPSGTVIGTIFISLAGAANTLSPITVNLTVIPNGTARAPFGTVDTPTDNRSGVTGAVPVTGWALDDIEVTRVSICRDAFGSEVAPIDPNCGGAASIFVGFAVFIDGARPDVSTAFSSAPLANRAGWGFMLLTNFLPNQGNGTYRFTMRAQDREGNWFVLGTRTMTCANAGATLPFGTIDTPEQGGLPVSGSSFINFGWALTPQPKTIPIDGSTIHVLVDGVDVGTASYNHPRPDIQALFPGFNNTNGAIGFRILDTTTLANGLHTISWVVTDNQGATEGLGSRFFSVSNGGGAVTAASASVRTHADIEDAPLDFSPLPVRRGWNLDAPFALCGAGATGVTVIRSEEVSRVELQLGDGDITGYLRTPAGAAPLPIGSRLDPTSNTFTWAPGVGFVGRYDFVFARSIAGRVVSRRAVGIILHPKGRGAVGPQVVIDTPRARTDMRAPFLVAGWAVDLDAVGGTGVTTLHAWAFPVSGGVPIFLGATAYGGVRPDVAAVHGDRFRNSGFGLIVQGLPAGDYDLALFAWSTETMGFVAPQVVRITVTP